MIKKINNTLTNQLKINSNKKKLRLFLQKKTKINPKWIHPTRIKMKLNKITNYQLKNKIRNKKI